MKRSMTVIQEEDFEESAMASHLNFNGGTTNKIKSGTMSIREGRTHKNMVFEGTRNMDI